jgi:hypothetical protein
MASARTACAVTDPPDAVFIVERSIDSEARTTGGVSVRGNVPTPLITLHRYELLTGSIPLGWKSCREG